MKKEQYTLSHKVRYNYTRMIKYFKHKDEIVPTRFFLNTKQTDNIDHYNRINKNLV